LLEKKKVSCIPTCMKKTAKEKKIEAPVNPTLPKKKKREGLSQGHRLRRPPEKRANSREKKKEGGQRSSFPPLPRLIQKRGGGKEFSLYRQKREEFLGENPIKKKKKIQEKKRKGEYHLSRVHGQGGRRGSKKWKGKLPSSLTVSKKKRGERKPPS